MPVKFVEQARDIPSAKPEEHARQRKRRWHSKVRSGCSLCRQRRVKCDEVKPGCNRCRTLGHRCPGYEAPKIWLFEPGRPPDCQRDQYQDLQIGNHPSNSPFTNNEGPRSFQYYFEVSEPSVSRFFGAQMSVLFDNRQSIENAIKTTEVFWKVQFPRLVCSVPAMQSCLLVMTTAHEHVQKALHAFRQDPSCIRKYGAAVSHLREEYSNLSVDCILLGSLLLAIGELANGPSESGLAHLYSAYQIIQQRQQDSSRSEWHVLREEIDGLQHGVTLLFKAFFRKMSRENFLPPSKVGTVVSEPAVPNFTVDLPFSTLQQAIGTLEEIKHAARRAIRRDVRQRDEKEAASLLSAAKLWMKAADEFVCLPREVSAWGFKIACLVLRIHGLTVLIISTLPSTELGFDSQKPLFCDIADAAEELFDKTHGKCSASINEQLVHGMGLVNPLFFAATKCRDYAVRRRLLGVLKVLRMAEGPWTSCTAYQIAARLSNIEIEEMIGLSTSRVIPSLIQPRLLSAQLEDPSSVMMLYTVRTSSDLDTTYTERFGIRSCEHQTELPIDLGSIGEHGGTEGTLSGTNVIYRVRYEVKLQEREGTIGGVTVPTKNGAFLVRDMSWHPGLRLPIALVENLNLMGAMINADKGVNQDSEEVTTIKMAPSSVENELPELSDLFPLRSNSSSIPCSNLRRSPRKKSVTATDLGAALNTGLNTSIEDLGQARRRLSKRSPEKRAVATAPHDARLATRLRDMPLLPRGANEADISASSKNRSSPRRQYKPDHLPHVDSLLLPLSKLAMQEDRGTARTQSRVGSLRTIPSSQKSMMSMMTDAARQSTARQSPRKTKQVASFTSRYVLKEARCNDDGEESGKEEDEDEDTDLSGFIVDDNAELSYHESSGSDAEHIATTTRRGDHRSPRRRLHRGPRHQSNSNAEDPDLKNEDHGISSALANMTIRATKSKHTASHQVEVIDLTSSPAKPNDTAPAPTAKLDDLLLDQTHKSVSRNLFDDFDRILRLSPPKPQSSMTVPEKYTRHDTSLSDQDDLRERAPNNHGTGHQTRDAYTTPPASPPQSPSKLKSPSKLLSPSKRDPNFRSPHRQSTDAFWDLHTINEWNDINSPKKAPAASPRKQGLARFQIWSDDSDNESSRISDNSLPSPCESPNKPVSPQKSPEKAEKRRFAEEKKAEKARKAAFDSDKRQLALDLLEELDAKIADGRLGNLAAGTGGVNINWSKTLRSTAGRANWRRTVTKNSGSPVKGNVSEGPGIKVEHFANIELAEKVIDCDERLVNTLAHEFCHLANFMVSNIRDQPHGASFKSWAAKVTKHLRKSENELWRKVEVTTKHNYAINHKYLWVCVGRDQTKAMEFLNLDDDGGCGVEYGRHSKSIDPEKSRCGRCKGKLVQVRPKPRMSPVKKIEKMIEVVELSD